MAFALCPDSGPPRLIRFCQGVGVLDDNIVATLDKENNLLRINKPLYDQLSEKDQRALFLTQEACVFVKRGVFV